MIGANALFLMYAWLLAAIIASYLSGRKGYTEKPGLAAGLLLTVIGLGKRIIRQAGEITGALDGAQENTAPLFAIGATNAKLERIAGGLKAVRERGESA